MARRLLIDTDTASDDAVALVMALRNPEIHVEAITVVAGNVPLDQAVQNALYTVELCGSDVPVFAGEASPLVQSLTTAQEVHGEDGMGDISLPLFGRTPTPGDAVDVLTQRMMEAPGEIDMVTIGPLTNVALALQRTPQLASAIGHCYIMGGTGTGPGNVTPIAEFNFWADPEAARIVVAADMLKTIIGWDISVASATFDKAAAAQLRSLGRFGEFAVDIQRTLDEYARATSNLKGFDLPDPIAMAVAMDPSIGETVHVFVEVLDGDGPARGVQSTDWNGLTSNDPNTNVVTHVERSAFLASLHAALAT